MCYGGSIVFTFCRSFVLFLLLLSAPGGSRSSFSATSCAFDLASGFAGRSTGRPDASAATRCQAAAAASDARRADHRAAGANLWHAARRAADLCLSSQEVIRTFVDDSSIHLDFNEIFFTIFMTIG